MESIINDMIAALIQYLNRAIAFFLKVLVSDLLGNDYVPTLSNIQTYLLGENGSANLDILMSFFRSSALVVITGLFFFHGYLFALGNLIELKDSIFKVIARMVVCIIFIYTDVFYSLMNAILTAGSEAFMASNKVLSSLKNESVGQTISSAISKTILDYDLEETVSESVELGMNLSILNALLGFILGCIIIYQFLKLCVEMIQRFVSIFCLFISMPLASSTLASATTQNIFFSYLQMFTTELIGLIYVKIWITLTLFVMGNVAGNVIGLLAIIAFIKFGQSIKDVMRSMGLTTSNTGPALLDTCAYTGTAMMMMARGASIPVGAMGKGLTTLGINRGEGSLVKAGNLLQGRDTSLTGVAREMQKANITPLNASTQGIMDTLYKKGDNGSFSGMYNNLSASDKKSYMQHLNNDILNGGSGSFVSKLSNGLTCRPTGINTRTGGLNLDVFDKTGQKIAEGHLGKVILPNSKTTFTSQDVNGDNLAFSVTSANLPDGYTIKASDIFNPDTINEANLIGLDSSHPYADNLTGDKQNYSLKYDASEHSAIVYDDNTGISQGVIRLDDGNYYSCDNSVSFENSFTPQEVGGTYISGDFQDLGLRNPKVEHVGENDYVEFRATGPDGKEGTYASVPATGNEKILNNPSVKLSGPPHNRRLFWKIPDKTKTRNK